VYREVDAADRPAGHAGPAGHVATPSGDPTLWPEFVKPGVAWRGKPFWSWNGLLNRDELIRQIHVMKEMGFGGFFMHSRTGLETEYLGDEWFDLINECADEAEKLGMEAWLYDEDRWPSGTAGGLVTADPAHQAKFLVMDVMAADHFVPSADVVAAFIARVDGLRVDDCQRIDASKPCPIRDGRSVIRFTQRPMKPHSFYNGHTYVDTLSREATQAFIDVTHAKYKDRCGDRLGRSIKGIFTDEPHRGPLMCGFGIADAERGRMIPWTEKLPQAFLDRFGYDLLDHLPSLLLQPDGRAVAQVKWHFCELTQQMFLDCFAKPMLDWCRQNNVILTGHVLHEDSLSSQVAMQGSLMRFYEYMDYPGIDILSEGNRCYWAAKQLQSAARQLGQKWLLSELYGCTGWEMTFKGHKAVGDWQALFGINLRCHHLSWYTMRGESKRDYPASVLHQSAWHADYDYVETYFSRLGRVLSAGEPVCDLLVVNPVESIWCQVHAGWLEGLRPTVEWVTRLEQRYRDTFHALAGGQIDFDYGDEEMMSRHARVEMDPDGPRLVVGQQRYRAVLLSGMVTIRSSTVALIEEFAANGGRVIVAGDAPAYVDALPDASLAQRWQNLAEHVAAEAKPLRAAVVGAGLGLASVTSGSTGEAIDDVFAQMRRDGDRTIVVALNVNRDVAHRGAKLRLLQQASRVERWDCRTGERQRIPFIATPRSTSIDLDFEPAQEHVFVLYADNASDGDAVKLLATSRATAPEGETLALEGPFEVTLDEPNVLVLDAAQYRIDGGEWQGPLDILKADRAVRRHFNLPVRAGDMVQPWYRKRFSPEASVVAGRVTLRFSFEVAAMPGTPVRLSVERPERFAIELNGQPIYEPTGERWIDEAFTPLAVPASALRLGENTIEMTCKFVPSDDLEAIYLLGDFGVSLEGMRATVTPPVTKLNVGDVTKQGLPFYGAGIRYRVPMPQSLRGRAVRIWLPKFEAALARVSGATGEPKLIAFHPQSADLDPEATATDLVDLQLTLTRRNTFGPLHQLPLRASAYGPANWMTDGEGFASDEFVLLPSGLLASPQIAAIKL
jgi:hypothetical protein